MNKFVKAIVAVFVALVGTLFVVAVVSFILGAL